MEQPLNLAYDSASGRLFATDQGLEQIRGLQADSLDGFESKHPGNRVVVLDPDDGGEIVSIDAGEGPIAPLLDVANGRFYVTNRGSGSVSVFDSGSYALLDTVELPAHPNSLAVDGQRKVLYVTIKNGRDAARDADESVARLAF
ncbi:MAG: YncE family protein [Luteimonas sp.]